ncbi:hypothetical protein F5X98DRAFT_351803 [Xylaria grammica]|nr:hypothetical protein F5X98DRAFT_351803 [Xylaria grammica]
MGVCKDQMIHQMEEERADLEETLDDIEVYGERFMCPRCDGKACNKHCFARSCFDWCLTHSYPSVEDRDGTASITVRTTTKDSNGQVVDRIEDEQRRVCGSREARNSPGRCRTITSSPSVSDIIEDRQFNPFS